MTSALKKFAVSSAAVFVLLTSGPLMAHPGANILTTGSSAPRASMTSGVNYEIVEGVHLFKGSAQQASEQLLLLGSQPEQRVEIEIRVEKRPFRQIRKMRTQGFYSGDPYKSRRYTQGFYSGD